MFITSQMIFRLLSNRVTLEPWDFSAPNCKIHTIRLYRGQAIQEGHLYIMDELTDLCTINIISGCAALILARTPHILPDGFRLSDAAFVKTEMNRLDLFDEVQTIFDLLRDWDISLKDACYEGASIKVLMDIGNQLLDAPLQLYDMERDIWTSTKDIMDADESYEKFLDYKFKAYLSRKNVYSYSDDTTMENNLFWNIFYKGKTVAIFSAAIRSKSIHEGDKLIFQHLAEYITASHLNETNYVLLRSSDDERHRILREILFTNDIQKEAENVTLMMRFGWIKDHNYRVVVLQKIHGVSTNLDAAYLRQKLENSWPNTCLLTEGSRFVWVLNDTLSKKYQSSGHREYFVQFVQEHMLKAGISDIQTGLYSIPRLFEQACATLAIGHAKHPHLWSYSFRNYQLDYIIEIFCQKISVEQTIHQGIRKLIIYDRENNMEYVETLRYYIESRFNAAAAAEKVFVHRSTFTRRMERIEEISQINLQNSDELLHVMLSLRICDQIGFRNIT